MPSLQQQWRIYHTTLFCPHSGLCLSVASLSSEFSSSTGPSCKSTPLDRHSRCLFFCTVVAVGWQATSCTPIHL